MEPSPLSELVQTLTEKNTIKIFLTLFAAGALCPQTVTGTILHGHTVDMATPTRITVCIPSYMVEWSTTHALIAGVPPQLMRTPRSITPTSPAMLMTWLSASPPSTTGPAPPSRARNVSPWSTVGQNISTATVTQVHYIVRKVRNKKIVIFMRLFMVRGQRTLFFIIFTQ